MSGEVLKYYVVCVLLLKVHGGENGAETSESILITAPDGLPPQVLEKPLSTVGPLPVKACFCGIRGRGNTTAGITAGLHEFPWRCALYSPKRGVFCGATIIDNSWVMTAAHCTKSLAVPGELYVDCGDHDIQTLDDTDNVLTKVDRIVQHGSYNSTSQDYDMSLLHLSTPLTYSKAISPVCLPFANEGKDCETNGTMVTASGWGSTSSDDRRGSAALHKVDLPCLGTRACQEYYDTSVTDNMICTYQPGKDTCYGDSGSSIDLNVNGRYFALGVVSWGIGCAEEGNPGVYAKVSKFLPWIQSVTNGSFCNTSSE